MTYTVHSTESAAEGARSTLKAAKEAYGFVPNLLGVMAEAPALLKGYATLSKIFEESSFTPAERQVVLLTTSFENGCSYCMAAHSAVAGMQRVPQDVIQSLRTGDPIADARLEALRQFTAKVVETRGWPAKADVSAFHAAGFSKAQVLEVVLGVGLKTLSNYANHIADTPLDAAFKPLEWSRSA
ncbi:MAG TPA: carboxymuconolactone decarboxylase [Parvularcula sp.]|nr:carboxymuconolactone decarboxylase [Parvularcula sp.]